MKIVLINVRTSYIMAIPFGITYLAAVLRNNHHEVKLYDIYPEDNVNEIIHELSRTFAPDLIGFSVLTTNFYKSKKICSELKKIFPNAIYCAGGIHPTVRPIDTIKEMGLHFVVIGEGENVIVKVCDALEKSENMEGIKGIAFIRNNKEYINKELDVVEDLDLLPYPARELLPVSKYLIPPGYIRFHFLNRVLSVLTSRGCPYKCTFCNSSAIFHNRVRRRTVDNVMNEINYLIEKYNIDGIYFHDESFTVDYEWVKEICIKLKPLKLPWGCQTRVNLVNNDLLKIMHDAGCVQIDFGIESVSKRMLKILKKGTTPEQSRNALELTRKNKVKSFASFMVGLPDETKEDIEETIKFLKIIKPDFTYFNLYTPFPGTEATETAIKEGKIPYNFFNKDYDMLLETVPLVNLSSEKTETIIKYHKRLRNMVLLKNYFGIITMNNLKYCAEAIFYYLLSPKVLITSCLELLLKMNFEKYIFIIFSNYQKHKSQKIYNNCQF